jgi:hypothetical protein
MEPKAMYHGVADCCNGIKYGDTGERLHNDGDVMDPYIVIIMTQL